LRNHGIFTGRGLPCTCARGTKDDKILLKVFDVLAELVSLHEESRGTPDQDFTRLPGFSDAITSFLMDGQHHRKFPMFRHHHLLTVIRT
jgi:hypothetical protein